MVRVHVLVPVILKEGLLGHLKVLHPGLLVEGVQLVLGQVVHDAGPVGVPHHIDGGPETITGREQVAWTERHRR